MEISALNAHAVVDLDQFNEKISTFSYCLSLLMYRCELKFNNLCYTLYNSICYGFFITKLFQ